MNKKVEKRKYSDRREYFIRAVALRRHRIKEMAVAYKGGQCEACGYNCCVDAFDFHHRDSSQKDFGISEKGYTRSWKRVMGELDKCQLLCANCHRELHSKLAALKGNLEMTSGLIQGNRNAKGDGNPELSAKDVMVESAETLHPLP